MPVITGPLYPLGGGKMKANIILARAAMPYQQRAL